MAGSEANPTAKVAGWLTRAFEFKYSHARFSAQKPNNIKVEL